MSQNNTDMKAESQVGKPLLQAIDLKKYYPVKKGFFAPERLVKALDGVSFTLSAAKPWRWWGSLAVVNPHWAAC